LVAGKLDRTWPGIVPLPLMREIKSQAPQIECGVYPWNIPRLLIINRDRAPFDNPDFRRAIALSLDRRPLLTFSATARATLAARHCHGNGRGAERRRGQTCLCDGNRILPLGGCLGS
jgi:hypothetical protein